MRRYQRIAVAVLLVLVGIWLVTPYLWAHAVHWLTRAQALGQSVLAEAATPRIAYGLESERWLEFALPSGTPRVRVISNAHIEGGAPPLADEHWQYQLHYQLLGRDRRELLDGFYHHRTGLSLFRDAQGKIIRANYYAQDDVTPLDGQTLVLGQPELLQAAFLRLRLVAGDARISGAVAGVYIPDKIAEYRVGALWFRMSAQQQEQLAQGSVYPAALLSPQEKLNLLRNQWMPLGPVGVEGVDYHLRTLYKLRDIASMRLQEVTAPRELQADAQHPAIIPLPEQGGLVTLHITLPDRAPLLPQVPVQLRWYGRTVKERWQQQSVWTPAKPELSFALQGGILEVQPATLVAIKAELRNLGGESQAPQDITPAPLSVKTYKLQQGVEFPVRHFDAQPAALRIDVRSLVPAASTAPVQYQWLNPQKQIVRQGTIAPPPQQPSRYDRLDTPLREAVSDPASAYFNLPANVTSLRLTSANSTSLINAYNQPHDFIKRNRVPEDAYVGGSKPYWYPAWFKLNAGNEQQLKQQQAVVFIAAQYRPPEDSADINAGQYLWEDYLPEGAAAGFYLLTQQPPPFQQRDAALPSQYCQLPIGMAADIDLKAFGELRSLTPELIFLRDRPQAFALRLEADGQPWAEMQARGKVGTIRLPVIAPGRHPLRLTTAGGGQWLLNHVQPCAGNLFLKRRVFKLEGPGLSYIYERKQATEEVLSARLYLPEGENARAQLDVSIEALDALPAGAGSVLSSWTFRHRHFDVRSPGGPPSPLLYSEGNYLNNGESFFIPLGSDLPAGRYRVRIRPQQSSPAYLTLAKLTPGLQEQRRFFKEAEVAD